ncbi:hypothetical protein [Hydrogenivirga sp. 128-5-R1-1]|uniref:hypothetical protein n=1 Tax=Hydrogenivirga sp. 128-5-R1-1 TaxID=392423 RepID=UPI00015F155F|nr:hypothetical protein [Hydrogenivirga sp. 128-5-R1-1]EDP74777.1 hypothetical protein HG1285_08804 [Hydrogenivirga sp. 128-5-R1-1]
MRFFISSNIKNNAPLYITVVFFLLSSLLYWVLSWLLYHFKFGLTYEKMYTYFFTDVKFPERLPLGQLYEDIHIQLFLHVTFILVLSSIFIHKCIRDRVKYTLILISFLSGVLELLSGLLVYYLSPAFIYVKLMLFYAFQISTGAMLLLALKLYLSKEKEEPPERSVLYSLVFIFSLSTLLFTFVNFFLFVNKIGITPGSVAEYYLGSPEKFLRPKTLSGLLSVVTPHLITMGIYLFTLVHFVFFTSAKRKIMLSSLTMTLALLDNFGGVFIRFLDPSFAYLKLLSFLGLSFMMVYLPTLIMVSILKHRAKTIILL